MRYPTYPEGIYNFLLTQRHGIPLLALKLLLSNVLQR